MTPPYHNHDTLGVYYRVESVCYLFGKSFLYLEPAGVNFSDPSELGAAHHMVIRHVANVHLLRVQKHMDTKGEVDVLD
jgi:hypothetical protein